MGIGYKEQCIHRDGAIAFWSFDGDRFDRDTYYAEENFIQDDVDNQHPAVVIDDPTRRAFRIGFPSGNSIEQSNQTSARFGDPILTRGAFFSKSMLTVQHTQAFDFRKNHGSFTLEFFFKKPSEWLADDVNDPNRLTQGQLYPTKYAPIIRKMGVFQIGVQYDSNGTNLLVSGPMGQFTISSSTANFESAWQHCVLSFNIRQVDEYNWSGSQTLWLNNRIRGSSTRSYVDFPPNTNIGAPIEIGGFSTLVGTSTNSAMGDRNCYYLDIDQIALYDFGFDYDKVCEHFKKTRTYSQMIVSDGPLFQWKCTDGENPSSSTPDVSIWAGGCSLRSYLKGNYLRDQPGPDKIPTEKSINFKDRGWAVFEKWCGTYQCGEVRNPTFGAINSDYTVEMWFRTTQSGPCTLFAIQGYDGGNDWTGPKLVLNMRDRQPSVGAMTFYEAGGNSISIPGDFTLGEWFYVAVVRRGNNIELWVNSEMRTSKLVYTAGALSFPGMLQIFADGNNTYAGPGSLSNFALFNYALHPAQIKVRHLYDIGYEIKGLVTIQGNPAAAIIRVYLSNTGAFVGEYESDPTSGEYRIPLYSNSNVDLLVYDKYNKNVRYRAFGPVAPSGYDDFPITI